MSNILCNTKLVYFELLPVGIGFTICRNNVVYKIMELSDNFVIIKVRLHVTSKKGNMQEMSV